MKVTSEEAIEAIVKHNQQWLQFIEKDKRPEKRKPGEITAKEYGLMIRLNPDTARKILQEHEEKGLLVSRDAVVGRWITKVWRIPDEK